MKSNVFSQGVAAGVLFCSLLSSTFAAQKLEPGQENLEKGQAIYKKHCQVCHGEKGLGDGPAGKRMNPKPLNFADKEKMAKIDNDHLFKDISKGKGPMPAFERKLKEDERRMVIHYIRTFSK